MRESYSSMSYSRFLEDLREEIHYSARYTQRTILPLNCISVEKHYVENSIVVNSLANNYIKFS